MDVQLHDACKDSAHPCFPCKLTLWRSEGRSPFLSAPEGWRGPSGRELARRHLAEAKAKGVELESATKHYYGPVSV